MKIPLLNRIVGKQQDTPATPPGWQPAALTRDEYRQYGVMLSLPVDSPSTRVPLPDELSCRLGNLIRTLPGALSGRWNGVGGAIRRIQEVSAALNDVPEFTALPPLWQQSTMLVIIARTLQTLHGIQVEFPDGHLWDPLTGPLAKPWRWRFSPARYPDGDWQEAYWLTMSLVPEPLMQQLRREEGIWPQLFSALTQKDNGEGMLSRLADGALLKARGEATEWPDTSGACRAVSNSHFCGTTEGTPALRQRQEARLARLDRESGMSGNVRIIWNTTPLIRFLALVQNFPAAPRGPYSEIGGLATLVCDALQVAVRLRKACALPPDEPEEQMRQGEAWNTAVWFTVLLEGLERLHQIEVSLLTDGRRRSWAPDDGPVPEGIAWSVNFRPCGEARARAVHTLTSLMPPGLLSWFRPFPLLSRTFTAALADHISGGIILRIARDAVQKASEQWLRDRGLPVTADAGIMLSAPLLPTVPFPGSPQDMTANEPVVENMTGIGELDTSSTQIPQTGQTPLDDMLNLLSPDAELPPTESQPLPRSSSDGVSDIMAPPDQHEANGFLHWLRNGLADGTLAVNTPDALVHVWSPGFVFIEYPAIVRRWASLQKNNTEEQDLLWKSVQRQLRQCHFFLETDEQPQGRLQEQDGGFRNVKGHLVSPGKLFNAGQIPPSGHCFTLRKKK